MITIIFYDFEVTKFDWLVVAIDPDQDEPYIIVNDLDALKNLYNDYKEDIWVGYNNRHYDQYIMKALLCGFSAWEMNRHIIIYERPGWEFSSLLQKIFMINFDCMIAQKSLKELEGFQGHSIYESSVEFSIERPLTDDEITEMVQYCFNDVKETMNIFAENINEFNALLWLVQTFEFPISYLGKTKAQISAEILECSKTKRDDEWDISVLPCIKLKKYKAAARWFLNDKNHFYKTADGNKNIFKLEVAGITHVFGWGGIHGGVEKYHYKCDSNHLMLHVDVASYYPRLMIFHNLLTRSAKHPERFKEIYDKRISLKKAGKKKEQAPLKIVINGTYGITKDITNKAYDPRNANLICVNGQLMLVDLIEHLESVKSFELIQSNTDGLIIKILKSDFDLVDDICYEWEQRCNMELEFDYIEEIWEKDVNNYVFRQFDGKVERKGSYVKELYSLDNDLPIVNKAVVDNILKNIPVETTINSCDEFIMFQKVSKLTKLFTHVVYKRWIYGENLGEEKHFTNKCYRIFASTDKVDGAVYKAKGDRLYKFPNTSEHSFIENGDIRNVPIPEKLDKQWYIDLAKERLRQYGVSV